MGLRPLSHRDFYLQMSLNIIAAARARRKESDSLNPDSSPVKTVLGSLNTVTHTMMVTNKNSSDSNSLASKRPKTIDEVPFR